MTNKLVRFIGDVHGNWKKYKKIVKESPNKVSLQLGDFGVGFLKPYTDIVVGGNPPYDTMASGSHLWLRGNHDNPAFAYRHPFWVEDGTYAKLKSSEGVVWVVGGAQSIDKQWRAEGYTWWEDEELSYGRLSDLLSVYEQAKPDIVATHEAPQGITDHVIAHINNYSRSYPSRTSMALQAMFEIHKPAIWLHGHHHVSYRRVVLGTEFIGVGEHEFIDLDLQ